MSTFAIGDLQGCYDELMDLLNEINFSPSNDKLWFTGDLVNRGPQSLKCLRFVKSLGSKAVTVLGNHDLHLLAIGNGQSQYMHKGDTLAEILNADDRTELLDWLRRLPLIYHHEESNFTMLHAGLPPQWDLAQAINYAKEVEQSLTDTNHRHYFENMYGNKPDIWSDDLTDWDRLRFITNCFTRIRYCHENGRLDMQEKGVPGTQDKSILPWFEIKKRSSHHNKIIFGHWASLRDYRGDYKKCNVYPLDTGCVWGGDLTALHLEDEKYFRVPSRQKQE